MDFNQQNNQSTPNRTPYSQSPYRPLQGNMFSTLSIYLGIASLLSLCTGILPFFLGSLSILFALLSKGYHVKMHKSALIGAWTSAIAIFLSIITFASSILLIYISPEARKEFHTQMNEVMELQSGMSFDEFMEEYYHITIPEE